MDTNTLLLLLVALAVIVIVALAVLATGRRRKREELKDRFGPEYDHAVEEFGSPDKAQAELQAREKRVEAFDIHPLKPGERDRFAEEWRKVQAKFVDDPEGAVADADRLVKEAMQARGYPVGDFEQRAADISVDHPTVVTHYRTAHEIALKQAKGKATTEDLRQAMVHYRALFEDLLEPERTDEVQAQQKQKERSR